MPSGGAVTKAVCSIDLNCSKSTLNGLRFELAGGLVQLTANLQLDPNADVVETKRDVWTRVLKIQSERFVACDR